MSDISGSGRDTRRELAHFLRSRRERVLPTAAGLPDSLRRRVPGLRREEVAILAGVSPTWYTYLEQGRDIHPSVEVLQSLARVLNLSEDERRHLHRLARGSPLGQLSADLPSREIVRQLVATTQESPYPTYAADVYSDLIAWNPAACVYYGDFGQLPGNERNMLRWLVHSPHARQRLPEWESDVRDVVARWRAATWAHRDDPVLAARLLEMKQLSPQFAKWWDSHDVREHRTRLRRFRLADGTEQVLRLIVMQSPEFAPSVVVFHVPASSTDDRT